MSLELFLFLDISWSSQCSIYNGRKDKVQSLSKQLHNTPHSTLTILYLLLFPFTCNFPTNKRQSLPSLVLLLHFSLPLFPPISVTDVVSSQRMEELVASSPHKLHLNPFTLYPHRFCLHQSAWESFTWNLHWSLLIWYVYQWGTLEKTNRCRDYCSPQSFLFM